MHSVYCALREKTLSKVGCNNQRALRRMSASDGVRHMPNSPYMRCGNAIITMSILSGIQLL
jgi:hypothetical protein